MGFKKIYKDFFSKKRKFDTPIWPHPVPRDHDLNLFVSTLPKNASTQVSAFQLFCSNGFLENISL